MTEQRAAQWLTVYVVLTAVMFCLPVVGAQTNGELKKWHKVTLTFDGPKTSETAEPNPFLDYRL
ncbi:MAG: hypothetical protein KAT00_05840, partial [Planctomycetes bacterium]|nr:hypothetical protein [Planctomycetota bacterium]